MHRKKYQIVNVMLMHKMMHAWYVLHVADHIGARTILCKALLYSLHSDAVDNG